MRRRATGQIQMASRRRGSRGLALAGLIAAPAVLGGSPPARAEDITYASVEGYVIQRTDDPSKPRPCKMFRQYQNPKDNGKESAILVSQGDQGLFFTVVYTGWSWPADSKPQTSLSVDRTLINDSQVWYSGDSALATKLPESARPKLEAGKRAILGFSDGTREFDLTGFKAAYAAVLKCNAAPRPAAPVAAAPPAPAPAAPAAPPPPPATVAVAPPTPPPPAAPPPPPATVAVAPPPAVTAPPAPAPAAPAPKPPVAAAAPPPMSPAKAPPAASAEEARAVAYLVGSYEGWAIDHCEMHTSPLLRDALVSRQAALEPDIAPIKARLLASMGPLDPKRCPPAAVLESTLQILIDEDDRAFVAKADPKTVSEFLGLVRPVLAGGQPTPTTAPPASARGLPPKARVEAFMGGLFLQDAVARCDVATTGRQRTAIDALVAALKPEMAAVEPVLRRDMEKNKGCGSSQAVERMLSVIGDGTPESAVAAIERAPPQGLSEAADEVMAAAAPQGPSEAQVATYMYGLLMQDAMKRCDIRSTGRQREGVDAKLATMAPQMAAVEPALRQQIRAGGDACPPPDRIADLEATLPLWLEKGPDDFSAEMDRRTAQRKGAPAKP